MHGNTKTAENSSLKTRHFEDIVHEITRSMKIHKEEGSILGGVHLELTGEVNEEGFSVVRPSLFPFFPVLLFWFRSPLTCR